MNGEKRNYYRETFKKGHCYAYLCISYRLFQQFLEVFISFLVLVTRAAPLCDRLTVEDEDMEERVEKEDNVGFNGDTVKEDGLRWRVKCIGHERGLNHDKRIVDICFIEDVSNNDGISIRVQTLNNITPLLTDRKQSHPDCY